MRDKLAKERAAKPRDPTSYTATALNPEYQKRTADLLAKVAPGGRYDAAKAGDYVEAFRKTTVKPGATFTVTASPKRELRVSMSCMASSRVRIRPWSGEASLKESEARRAAGASQACGMEGQMTRDGSDVGRRFHSRRASPASARPSMAYVNCLPSSTPGWSNAFTP